MNSQYRRPFGSKAGFSFIELLITMIIAGIAFAALVPVFVQAAKGSGQDRARSVALNIAQDAIENTRRITFEQVTTDTWTQNAQTATGAKAFTVQRVVVDQAASQSDARIVSKEITVTVSWVTPSPGGDVVVKTVLYRQYAGPQIVDFTVAPWDADNEWITDATVQLDAVINASDVSSMAPVDVGGTTLSGKVEFMITSVDGTVIPTISVPYDSGSPDTYTASWTTPGGAGANDGYWRFKAVAFSAQKYPGNTWEFVKRIESGPPAAVGSLVATPGLDYVNLTWSASISGDLDYYQVVRTDPDGSTTIVAGDPDDDTRFTGTGWNDTELLQDETYAYAVYAVDQLGNVSAAVSVTARTGTTAAVQPAPAADLDGQVFGSTVKLTWSVSPSSGVTGYYVYGNGDAATPLATVNDPYCSVEQGWNTTAVYQVKPFASGSDVGQTAFATLFAGPPVPDSEYIDGAAWLRISVGTEPRFSLNVMNNVQSGKSATITLQYLGLAGNQPGVTVTPVKTGVPYSSTVYGAQWTDLAAGWYQFSWVTENNKKGSRTVQLITPQLTKNEKCVP